ncbi:MAG TPA: alpha-L-fucosidase [Candidatus Binataceae bacterium]
MASRKSQRRAKSPRAPKSKCAQNSSDGQSRPRIATMRGMANASWFDTARFGMFIHWGPSSQRGWELSWPLVGGVGALPNSQSVAVDEYHATAPTFNPRKYDPRAWARLARRAGMQYAIHTTKHHDGFAMFHTRAADYSVEHTPFKRDIFREFLDAFRAEGIRTGLYFSLIDWHHPDYPAFVEADKPYRWGQWRRSSPEGWNRFVAVMFAQIRELLTNYGKIEVIWFDGGWERAPEEWKSRELVEMIRSLQPDILINDRLPGAGDYDTPEQLVPAKAPTRGWETCMTMNTSWGYNPSDQRYKSARYLINTLSEVAGKGGNLLLNVSPTGDGELPPQQVERLEAFAKWMPAVSESIVGTTAGLEPWQFYGPSTRRGKRIYLHLLMRPYEGVSIRGVKVRQVNRVSVLGSGEELRFHRRIGAADMLFPDPGGEIFIDIPEHAIDPMQTVLAVDFE